MQKKIALIGFPAKNEIAQRLSVKHCFLKNNMDMFVSGLTVRCWLMCVLLRLLLPLLMHHHLELLFGNHVCPRLTLQT